MFSTAPELTSDNDLCVPETRCLLAIGDWMLHQTPDGSALLYVVLSSASCDADGVLIPGQYSIHENLTSAVADLLTQALTAHDATALTLYNLLDYAATLENCRQAQADAEEALVQDFAAAVPMLH